MRNPRSSSLRSAVTSIALLVAVALPRLASAQEVRCDESDDHRCTYGIRGVSVPEVRPIFNLQARVAQARLPLGEARFPVVVVKVLRGAEVVCLEQIANVRVSESVLNLELGHNMSCDLAEVIARSGTALAFQVCLGGNNACLKPAPLATTPYAFSATWAALAQQAPRAEVAGVVSYAHRATADRDLLIRRKLSTGTFSFYTPDAGDARQVYSGGQYAPFQDGGWLTWTPLKDPSARSLHLVGKELATDRLVPLRELVLHGRRTLARGDLVVEPFPDGTGLTVEGGGLHVSGDSDVTGDLQVTGLFRVHGPRGLAVHGFVETGGRLTVRGAEPVRSGALHVAGASTLADELRVSDALTVQAGLDLAGGLTLEGSLQAAEASVVGPLGVAGGAAISELHGTGDLRFDAPLTATAAVVTGQARLGGRTEVGGDLEVHGEAVFRDHVLFAAGADAPGGAPDLRYVQAEGEERNLTLGGAFVLARGTRLRDDLDVQGHQMLRFRFLTAAAPPGRWGGGTEGFLYVDTAELRLKGCVGGQWVHVGRGACGDGRIIEGEGCDDGNRNAGDGCSPTCTVEPGRACQSGAPSVCS